MEHAVPLQRIQDATLREHGVSLHLLRLDRIDHLAPGNKYFKLKYNVEHARELGFTRLLSFGGAWSNHIHALAATGRELGIATVGVIRGERPAQLSPTLRDARRWGMHLVFVSRGDYRRRHDRDFLQQIMDRVGEAYVIPEGGANQLGVAGCREIVDPIDAGLGDDYDAVAVACGTGATLAGIAAALPASKSAMGFAVLKGADFMEGAVHDYLAAVQAVDVHNWSIDHRFHCGGYAKMDANLAEFILNFSEEHAVAIEPVYTGKMLYGLYYRIAQGEFPIGTRFVAVHTGGLQGLRGMQAKLQALRAAPG